MIEFKHRGNFKNTERILSKSKLTEYTRILDSYGREGVRALASATPKDSGKTASSWDYKIVISKGSFSLSFTNSHAPQGVPIAILLQYGHGTRNGGYVQGQDYINPVIKPIFDTLAKNMWKEITSV